jgi:hypothetical protein
MKYTVLDMTQSILSALDSDQVNSINDTVEASQVAECIRTSYNSLVSRLNLPANNQLIQLTASGSNAQPTLMTMPDGVQRLDWLKYFDTNPLDSVGTLGSHGLNLDIKASTWATTSSTSNTIQLGQATFTVASSTLPTFVNQSVMVASGANFMVGTVVSYASTTLTINVTLAIGAGTYTTWTVTSDNGASAPPGYQDIMPLTQFEFLTMVSNFNPTDLKVGSFTFTTTSFDTGSPSTYTFYYRNDRQPSYYMVLSNQYIIFDSYDQTQDVTLQSSKTLGSAWLMPSFQKVDSFIPVLDEQQFPLLLQEAKALAFAELKQMPHQKAELEVRRQTTALQKYKSIVNKPSYFEQLPDFGRRGAGYPRYSKFSFNYGRPNS